ncbi:MAG: ABC transporter ATP-binding protein [Lentisphaeria bacterium]
MAESATALVRVEKVTKRFRQGETTVEALRNLSLTVESGEFVAVMGASGSGKSTLLHVLAGLTRPDAGGIFIDGQNVSAMSDRDLTVFRRRRIGLVFQAFNLVSSLTAADNILLPLFCDGATAAGGMLDGLLKRLDLAPRSHHRPDALSGGEQQRVAIARALAANPALILADEPTGSLDSINGQKLCRLLRELCDEQKRTIMVVTHEPAVAIWARRVVVLRDGQILTQFKTADFPDAHALAAHYQSVVEVKAGAEVGR